MSIVSVGGTVTQQGDLTTEHLESLLGPLCTSLACAGLMICPIFDCPTFVVYGMARTTSYAANTWSLLFRSSCNGMPDRHKAVTSACQGSLRLRQ